jgi:hypothetical protein
MPGEVLNDIESEAEVLRSEIRGALTSIEDALRVTGITGDGRSSGVIE